MRRRWLFGIGLAAYALALVATLPATLLDSSLRRASGDRLRLHQTEGSLWSGRGQLELSDASGRAGVARNISWNCKPWSLFGGRLAFEIEAEQSPRRFPVAISYSRIEIADADIRLPARVLGFVLPRLAPLGLGGDVLLHIDKISLRQDGAQGRASMHWRFASSALTSVAPLGDYEIRFDSSAGAPGLVLRSLQGPLQIEGEGFRTAGGERLFQATLRVAAPFRQQLEPVLRLIAVEREEGVFELQLK